MKIALHFSDEVYDQYVRQASDLRQPIEQVMQERLQTFLALTPKDRYLILTGEPLQQLEDQFGLALQRPDQLLVRVQRLAALLIGEHRIEFTVGQWEELQHRAKKRGLTVAQEIEQIWQKLKTDFFTYV